MGMGTAMAPFPCHILFRVRRGTWVLLLADVFQVVKKEIGLLY
jgi:hypothetical protein